MISKEKINNYGGKIKILPLIKKINSKSIKFIKENMIAIHYFSGRTNEHFFHKKSTIGYFLQENRIFKLPLF